MPIVKMNHLMEILLKYSESFFPKKVGNMLRVPKKNYLVTYPLIIALGGCEVGYLTPVIVSEIETTFEGDMTYPDEDVVTVLPLDGSRGLAFPDEGWIQYHIEVTSNYSTGNKIYQARNQLLEAVDIMLLEYQLQTLEDQDLESALLDLIVQILNEEGLKVSLDDFSDVVFVIDDINIG